MAVSSPGSYARVTNRSSAGMRRFHRSDGANVDRWSGAALGGDADRPGADQKRVRKDPQDCVNKRGEHREARGHPVAQELVIAVLERWRDGNDLEAGMLQKLDQRRSRIENQVRTEVVRHPNPFADQIEQSLRVERRQQNSSAGFQK